MPPSTSSRRQVVPLNTCVRNLNAATFSMAPSLSRHGMTPPKGAMPRLNTLLENCLFRGRGAFIPSWLKLQKRNPSAIDIKAASGVRIQPEVKRAPTARAEPPGKGTTLAVKALKGRQKPPPLSPLQGSQSKRAIQFCRFRFAAVAASLHRQLCSFAPSVLSSREALPTKTDANSLKTLKLVEKSKIVCKLCVKG